jgi:hypothetical protein
MYLYQQPGWPRFTWQPAALEALLGAVRHQQGRVLGHMQALGTRSPSTCSRAAR